MLPSMPVLFPRESQSGDGFLQLLAPAPAPARPAPPVLQLADEAVGVSHIDFQNGSKKKTKEKEEAVPEKEGDVPESEEETNEISELPCPARSTTTDTGAHPKMSQMSHTLNHFVTTYYNKVKTKLGTEKFARFQQTLNAFTPDRDSPVQLYRRVEVLFGGDEELVEEFLLFLTPGQASEVGRFMDHLMLTRISKFIQNLQSTFARKPTKLRQVARALQGGSAGGAGALRARVEPHLRTSPRLLTYFRALLPDERLPDSLYSEEQTEEFPESAWADDVGEHRTELDEPPPAHKLAPLGRHSLDTAYLQGRVFLQEGRVLRPARVTFPGSSLTLPEHARRLAPPHTPHTSAALDSDDERASPRRAAAKNLNKSPKRAPKSPCARNIMKATKEKNISPERPTKTADAVKKTIKVVIDSQIEAKSAVNNSEMLLAIAEPTYHYEAIGSTLGLPNTADTVVRIKRKRDSSPNKERKISGRMEKKKSSKKQKRREARKTGLDAGKNHITKQANIMEKEGKAKSAKHKRKAKKIKEATCETLESLKIDHDREPFADTDFAKPEIPKLQSKRPEHVPNCDWTRSEDKTILQVLKRETESEETFTKIMELLPHRTIAEVKARFFHVMDLLHQMALGEVT